MLALPHPDAQIIYYTMLIYVQRANGSNVSSCCAKLAHLFALMRGAPYDAAEADTYVPLIVQALGDVALGARLVASTTALFGLERTIDWRLFTVCEHWWASLSDDERAHLSAEARRLAVLEEASRASFTALFAAEMEQ